MNIDKYIKWDELWQEQVCLQTEKDICEDEKLIDLIDCFLKEVGMSLCHDECRTTNDGEFVFLFSETGGQNESDTHGWSRDYTFTFDSDFMLVDAEYSQG